MINKNLLDELNRLGFGADVDALESYVASLQDAAGLGKPLVTDTVYDQHYRLLRELRPDSYVFTRNWEVEDNDLNEYDTILAKYGMRSITTIQNMRDLYKFKEAMGTEPLTLTASIKLNGHAIRAVYAHGHLYSGSTRGRYKKGRDITRHLKAVLPNYVEQWKDIRVVEVRGEMLVSLHNFEALRHILKTPLSAVTSLVRDSVTDDELKYLSCVCYKVIPEGGSLGLATLWDEFIHLRDCGFEIPPMVQVEDVSYYNLDEVVDQLLEYFGQMADNGEFKYATDGIVVAVDDLNHFYSMGMDGNAFLGNFALKMGRHWESNIYSSTILDVEFIPGKTYFTPKALIEPVVTVTGAEVSTVPLYNIGVMERLGLVPGAEIHFKFGGETGVTLVTPDGTAISALEK